MLVTTATATEREMPLTSFNNKAKEKKGLFTLIILKPKNYLGITMFNINRDVVF